METVTLYITVSHKTLEGMANQYHFDAEQWEKLAELLSNAYQPLWNAVLFGLGR